VSFDTGDVGGPSAGLAFTLALIDVLTPGELTGGERVAVTGAIGADGTVIPVGGTAQKAAAVRRAGIGVFLVPAEDYADALQTAGDVEVIEVTSVDGALRELVRLGGDRLEVPSVGAEELAPAG
jgi:Lon-like protease